MNTQESKIDSWLYSCMQIYSIKTYYENLAVYDTSNDNLSFLATRNKYSQSFLKSFLKWFQHLRLDCTENLSWAKLSTVFNPKLTD